MTMLCIFQSEIILFFWISQIPHLYCQKYQIPNNQHDELQLSMVLGIHLQNVKLFNVNIQNVKLFNVNIHNVSLLNVNA